MLEKIIENLTRRQERIAFQFSDRTYTYGALKSAVECVAAHLQSQGYRNQPIGVCLTDDFGTYASLIGVLLSGNSFVPVNPKQPFEYNKHVIQQSGIRELLYSGIRPSHEFGIGLNLTNFANGPECSSELKIDAGQTAYILFTSGSTGTPKGVPISVKNLEAFLEAVVAMNLSLSEQDRFMQMFELTFDLSIFCYLMPLTLGASVVPLEPTYPKYYSIHEALIKSNVTVALMVPSVMAVLKSVIDELRLPQLRYSMFCGEALLEADLTKWLKCCPNAEQWNVYGPTEATIFCTSFNISQMKSHHGIVSIGKPMAGTEIAIIDQNNKKITETNSTGELCLAGRQVTKGYLDPTLTEHAFFRDEQGTTYYRTGDLAFTDRTGELFFAGRRDSQVKIHGFRVELTGIQHCVAQFTLTKSIAIHRRLENGNDAIFLFVEGWKGSEADLRKHLRGHLPEYCWPFKIFFVDRFSYNVNGKINVKALEQMLA